MPGESASAYVSGSAKAGYGLVFLILTALTALEVGLTSVAIPGGVRTPVFLTLSLAKASLVATFYMHLRSDSRLYTAIFLLPALLFVALAGVMLVA